MTVKKKSTSIKKKRKYTTAAKRALQKRIDAANPDALQETLTLIRVQAIESLANATENPERSRASAEEVKALHSLWRNGKEILNDMLREEVAKGQHEANLTRLLELSNELAQEDLGWLDDED